MSENCTILKIISFRLAVCFRILIAFLGKAFYDSLETIYLFKFHLLPLLPMIKGQNTSSSVAVFPSVK